MKSFAQFLVLAACALAVAAVVTYVTQFEHVEVVSGRLGLAAFGLAMAALVIRRLPRS